jgi:hypothetical protein
VLEAGWVGRVAGDADVHAFVVVDGHAFAHVIGAVAAHLGLLILRTMLGLPEAGAAFVAVGDRAWI